MKVKPNNNQVVQYFKKCGDKTEEKRVVTFLWTEFIHGELLILQDDSNGPVELVPVSAQLLCLPLQVGLIRTQLLIPRRQVNVLSALP